MSVQSTPEFGIRLRAHLAGRRRGFTAIEMVAVATIMVILSLILVINVRKRVDESKQTAALEEMTQLGNLETLVYGETGHYVPLQDLDDTDHYSTSTYTALDIPLAFCGGNASYPETIATQYTFPGVDLNRQAMVKTNQWQSKVWQGPYTQFKKTLTLDVIDTLRPELMFVSYPAHPGPITAAEVLPRPGNLLDSSDKYPVDPWGNPYIFEVLPNGHGGRIYSLGPDGLPGTILPAQTADLHYADGNYFHTKSAGYPWGQLSNPIAAGSDDLVIDF